MLQMLMIFQVVVAVLLIISVLLQFGKGAEVGLMGGGASDSILTGAQRGNVLSKITIILSILFLGGSVNLARMQAAKVEDSIMNDEAPIALPSPSKAGANAKKKPSKKSQKKSTKSK
ncbi:MAG: preprotein translocase subunit SecG [Halobacteriovoraceae bacterium]|nr:preprotein translocase subunit SecG [Halobacteriovoraceae bacterium]